jgi:hypothetical protein
MVLLSPEVPWRRIHRICANAHCGADRGMDAESVAAKYEVSGAWVSHSEWPDRDV